MLDYFVDVPDGFSIEKDAPSVCSVCLAIVPIWGQPGHTRWHKGENA